MRIGIVAVVGLMAGVGAAGAQQAKAPNATSTVQAQAQIPTEAVGPITKLGSVERLLVSAGCPGQLVARQQATLGATMWVTAYEDRGGNADWIARPRGLGIHVEFADTKTEVKALELRVSYLPLGLRSMPAAPQMRDGVSQSPQERTKTFNLDREAAMQIGGDLLVGPAATITRVHLMSATFADGSVWRATSEDQCSVVPSKFMLVEAKR